MRFDMNGGNQNDEDDFDVDGDDESSRGFVRVLSGVFVLAAVGGFIALAWYAYQSGNQPVSDADIPMVAEDDSPIKESPKDPGGWQFDHQDKTVYNQLAAGKGTDATPVAERIMPSTEEPVARPDVLPPEEVTSAPVASEDADRVVGVQENTSASQVETVKTSTDHQQVSTQSVIPTPEPQPLPVEEVKSAPVAEKAIPAPVVVKETPKPAAASGKYMAQLGAFSSQAEAEKAWNKINTSYGSKFPTKSHRIDRADLGAKGVFYRLKMGPFDSDESVRKVCSYLTEKKQGCFPVKL